MTISSTRRIWIAVATWFPLSVILLSRVSGVEHLWILLISGASVLLGIGLWLWGRQRQPWYPIVMACIFVGTVLTILVLRT